MIFIFFLINEGLLREGGALLYVNDLKMDQARPHYSLNNKKEVILVRADVEGKKEGLRTRMERKKNKSFAASEPFLLHPGRNHRLLYLKKKKREADRLAKGRSADYLAASRVRNSRLGGQFALKKKTAIGENEGWGGGALQTSSPLRRGHSTGEKRHGHTQGREKLLTLRTS